MARDRSNCPLATLGGLPRHAVVTTTATKTPGTRRPKLAERLGMTTPKPGAFIYDQVTREMLADANRCLHHLDPWGQKFVASLGNHVDRHGGLTEKQVAKLREILSRV